MTETIEKNDAAGYVCPLCRIVFSTLPDLQGNGVICPGCQRLLRVPSINDNVNEINVVAEEVVKNAQGAAREIPTSHSSDVLSVHENSEYREGDFSLKLIIPILVLSLVTLGGVGYMFLRPAASSSKMKMLNEETVSSNSAIAVVRDKEDEEIQASVDLVTEGYKYDPSDEAQVKRMEDFLTTWYDADSIDKRLALVRPTEDIKEKMTRYYEKYPPAMVNLKSLEAVTELVNLPGYLAVNCETSDYKSHVGIVEYSEDSILLDWESYVVYSEKTWSELATQKPTEPVRVRVYAKAGHYYNNHFGDERKWRAVSLENPNEEGIIYGYVEINSANEQRIFNFGNTDSQPLILEIYYPPNAESTNQVYIGKVIQDGWFEQSDK